MCFLPLNIIDPFRYIVENKIVLVANLVYSNDNENKYYVHIYDSMWLCKIVITIRIHMRTAGETEYLKL